MVRIVTKCQQCKGIAFTKSENKVVLCGDCERARGNCGLQPCWCERCGTAEGEV